MNIQNLPRKEKVVKRAFQPKLDYLVFADYEAIEMRVLAYYMSQLGDDSMAEVLRDPTRDLHAEAAKGIFLLDREPTDPERQLGKNMNFSMVYGGGKPAVMRYLKAFVNDGGEAPQTWGYAAEVLERHHTRWPGIKRVVTALEASYASKGYIHTIAGARLHPNSNHKLLNALVQSGAAELTRKALREAHRNLQTWDSHLVVTVHDEIGFDVPDRELQPLTEAIPGWMDWPEISAVVPVTVSIEITDTNWAEKTEYHVGVRQ